MLQIKGLTYYIGERELLSDVHLNIHPGRRLGLIGPNGAGKTTFFRILAGELAATGEIIKSTGYRIGYLPQEEIVTGMGAILREVLEAQSDILKIQREMQQIHQQLSSAPQRQSLLERLGNLETRFSHLGGYQIEAKAKAILSGLGFRSSDFNRPMSEFSGGWRMRVHLAQLLLQNPDLLLLDEPTNHLDLPSLEWLEQYLTNFPGSVIFVSHDRFFLDRLAQEIIELYNGQMVHYFGNFQFYRQQKALLEEQLQKKQEQLQRERQHQQKFIDRFRYKATKAAQVQSRIKMLEKMEQVEIPPPPPSIHFKIKVEVQSFKEVLTIQNMTFKYDSDWVLKDIGLQLFRGDKIALVGPNGAGKTTLTRLIMGQLQPQRGTIRLGDRTFAGYYAQHQVDNLDLNATVYEEVEKTAAETYRARVRDILGIFRLSGDDVNKKIAVLSGGEKARVSLAKILLSPVNFLIMDEPTNHLDMASREALENALEEYDGTLLLISHDRFFLDRLVNRVVEIRDGTLKIYEGNYSDYLRKRELVIIQQPEEAADMDAGNSGGGGSKKTKEQKRMEAEARQSVSKERNRLEKEITVLEERISALENRRTEIQQQLARPETYKDRELIVSLQQELTTIEQDLPALLAQWERSVSAHEELISRLP